MHTTVSMSVLRKYLSVSSFALQTVTLIPILFLVSGCPSGPVDPGMDDDIFSVSDALDRCINTSIPAHEASLDLQAAYDYIVSTSGYETAENHYLDAIERIASDDAAFSVLLQRMASLPPKTITLNTAASSSKGATSPRNAIVFINGIIVTDVDFRESYKKLYNKLNILGDWQSSIDVIGIYNPTGPASVHELWGLTNNLGPIDDAFEALEFKLRELFGITEAGLSGDAFSAYLVAEIEKYMSIYDNIIFIPHSQGNMYLRYALGKVKPEGRIAMSIIETGSPVNAYPTGFLSHSRVDVSSDPVAALGLCCDTIGAAPYITYEFVPKTVEGGGVWDKLTPIFLPLSSHSFKDAYLEGESWNFIVDMLRHSVITPAPGKSDLESILGVWHSDDGDSWMNFYLNSLLTPSSSTAETLQFRSSVSFQYEPAYRGVSYICRLEDEINPLVCDITQTAESTQIWYSLGILGVVTTQSLPKETSLVQMFSPDFYQCESSEYINSPHTQEFVVQCSVIEIGASKAITGSHRYRKIRSYTR